jgi:hypothetical protein
MNVEQVRQSSPPIWFIAVDEETFRAPDDLFLLACECLGDGQLRGFRGVTLDRLPTVVRLGIDVEPTCTPIYHDHIDKAWEYGGFPKVILALDERLLDRTFREVPLDHPEEEQQALLEEFPTRVVGPEGSTLWFSKLAPDDPRLTKPYEWAYGCWIPGDAREALNGVFVIGTADDRSKVVAMLEAAD